MKTEFFLEYDLYDTTALQDARGRTDSNSAFADIGKLKSDAPAPRYGTLEHNLFVLDGSFGEFPDSPGDIAYFSKKFIQESTSFQYAGDGLCAGDELDGAVMETRNPQSVAVDFTENHSSYGITLHFMGEYPTEIRVKWYGLDGILKSQKTFCPDSPVYFCKNQVLDYGKLEIIFLRALPYHNAKLSHIKYGTTIVWGADRIKSGKLLSDTDPTSDKVKTDRLDFSFLDADDEFNFGNADGMHKVFQRNQHMSPYEMVDGERIMLGAFFLDSVSTSKNISKMTAVDYKGKMAGTEFMGGRVYSGEPAGGVIGEIMEAAGITDYTVDSKTASSPLYGTLPIQSCQKALREVLFATGSVVNTSRRAGVEIRQHSRKVTSKVERGRKFSTSFSMDKYVSDVSVKYKTWALDEGTSEITKGDYGIGTHTVRLSAPAANMAASGGQILGQTPYCVTLKVSQAQEIAIYGQKYSGTELAASAGIEHIRGGEARNAKAFSGTLLNYKSAKAAAERLLDYYQLQQIIKTKHIAGGEKTGDWAEVENVAEGHANFVAAAESMSTDLAGGFISTATFRGYFKTVTDYYFADGELCADEGLGGVI